MAHNPACERAKNPGCVCTGCGGSLHGWPTRLTLAEKATEPELARLRRDAELRWLTTLGTGKRRQNNLRKPPGTMKRAATQSAEADAIAWLAQDPRLISRSRDLGHGLNKGARQELHERARSAPGRLPTPEQMDRSTPGHFWCSLLAELSDAGDTVQGYTERVPELAKDALFAGENPPDWNEVQNRIAEEALTAVWKCAGAVLLGDFTNLIRIARLMSLFICPDPAKHPAMIRRCLVPLGEEILTEETHTRLRQSRLIDPDE